MPFCSLSRKRCAVLTAILTLRSPFKTKRYRQITQRLSFFLGQNVTLVLFGIRRQMSPIRLYYEFRYSTKCFPRASFRITTIAGLYCVMETTFGAFILVKTQPLRCRISCDGTKMTFSPRFPHFSRKAGKGLCNNKKETRCALKKRPSSVTCAFYHIQKKKMASREGNFVWTICRQCHRFSSSSSSLF